jgi:hypothetical protein
MSWTLLRGFLHSLNVKLSSAISVAASYNVCEACLCTLCNSNRFRQRLLGLQVRFLHASHAFDELAYVKNASVSLTRDYE